MTDSDLELLELAAKAAKKVTRLEKIVQHLHETAATGYYGGLILRPDEAAYFNRCRSDIQLQPDRGIRIIFTRDVGLHTSGWWKNPDYERCYHASMSFFSLPAGEPAGFDRHEAERWARMLFYPNSNLLWIEPPYSREGKIAGVWHYRLFCDEHWQPIKPRGEVYSKEFTEAGWKSFSEIHGERAKDYEFSMGDPT